MKDKRKNDKNKKSLLTAKAVAMISTLSMTANFTVFENFAIAAMWNDTEWTNFVNTTRTLEKSKTQTLITNTHTQHTQHTNYTSPHQNSGGIHSNSGGNHSEYISPHNNVSARHTNYTSPHTNYTSPHNNVSARHSNSTSPHTNYTSPHYNVSARHTNYTNPHTNRYTPHSNSSPHYDNWGSHTNRYTPHSNSYRSHTDYVTYWGGIHHNSGGHSNSGGYHSDQDPPHFHWQGSHTNSYAYHTNSGGGHNNTYTPHSQSGGTHSQSGGVHTNNYTPHSQYGGTHNQTGGVHTDNYTPSSSSGGTHSHYVSPHTQYTSPHTDASPHTQTSAHTNVGFDHQNYIPSKPALFNVAQNQQLSGNVKIGMYSYDKNYDNYGSTDTSSKTARYDLYIRKIKNLDGTSNVSAWRALVNDQPSMTADGGYTYTLNTVDPLGVGNTNVKAYDGYYEVKSVARNSPISGVTYQSPEQIVAVIIQQNQDPQITITNASEFINFTFGFDGALSSNNVYKRYTDGLYAGAASTQREGILVRISIKDTDTAATTQQNWQKGKMYLKNAAGTTISSVDIMWDNGTTTNTADDTIITSSEGANKAGYGFFPKDSYTNAGDMSGAKVIVEVTDYLDAACTKPAGSIITQGTVSQVDTTLLVLNIDLVYPTDVIDEVAHNQLINVAGQEVEVVSPDILAQGYTLAPQKALGEWNVFIDGDTLRYRLIFNVKDNVTANKIKDAELELNLNTTNQTGISYSVSEIKLKKLVGGIYTEIKNLNTPETLTIQQNNKLNIKIGKDTAGRNIIPQNGMGTYVIEYMLRLNTSEEPNQQTITIRNESLLTLDIINGFPVVVKSGVNSAYKTDIDTKVLKVRVIAR